MRTIKFRAWGKNSKEFLTDGKMIGFTLKEIQNIHDIDLWEFTQFTGLLDKNGKEIYEGDIVTGYTFAERMGDEVEWTKEQPATVTYDNKICGFYPFYYNARWRCDVESIEVIGNIYENPELIKPKGDLKE